MPAPRLARGALLVVDDAHAPPAAGRRPVRPAAPALAAPLRRRLARGRGEPRGELRGLRLMLEWLAVDDTRPRTDDVQAIAARLEQLELTLLEVVTALGMLVGELALREDLALAQPGVVEEALERGWQTLFGAAVDRAELTSGAAAGRAAEAEWADSERLARTAQQALEQAMDETGAAVGAVYSIDEARAVAQLLAYSGYPGEVMEQFRSFPLDADLPAAAVAVSRRPLWFAQ